MKIVILATLGALVLLSVGIYIILHFSDKTKEEKKTFLRMDANLLYGFVGYTCVIAAIFIVIVLQTSLTRQESALKSTQERFYDELNAFRERLGEQTEKLMSQLNEKAELTGSEVEVRGKLANEIEQHGRTRTELEAERRQLAQTYAEYQREWAAHRAYVDSLNTERALHASTQNRLERESRQHAQARKSLADTHEKLASAESRIRTQDKQLKELNDLLERTQANARRALENAELAAKRLLQKTDDQQKSIMLLQASVDSIYKKTLKRPRVPEPAPEAQQK